MHSSRSIRTLRITAFLFAYLLLSHGLPSERLRAQGINKVGHIVVIYLENHSFDNLFGEFPGANGLNRAAKTQTQVDSNGVAYPTLPAPRSGADYIKGLPNKPFNIDQFRSWDSMTIDLVHRYYQEQMQIDGGKMDKFALVSDAKGLTMGYYHTAPLPLAAEAKDYVLCDNFFHSAFGGSFFNHIFFIAGQPAFFPNAPKSLHAQLGPGGKLVKDGALDSNGYAINTAYSVNAPHPLKTPAANLMPNQTMPTIGDRMDAKNIRWAWYAGGWNDALAGHADSLFQYHHQPFVYFASYADGTAAKAAHLKDETEFLAAAKAGTLPEVSFVKPLGEVNEHPGYAALHAGEMHVEDLINAVRNGPNWNDCVIIITYDEHGGFWDHVKPPVIDKWGPGLRVPGIIVSPFAKHGVIDHTQYETMSIISFIEKRFGLKPLGTRDAKANPFKNAFRF